MSSCLVSASAVLSSVHTTLQKSDYHYYYFYYYYYYY